MLLFLRTLRKCILFWAFFTRSAVCRPQVMSLLMLTSRRWKPEILSTDPTDDMDVMSLSFVMKLSWLPNLETWKLALHQT